MAWMLLALAKHIAEQNARLAEGQASPVVSATTPATPSGMIPVYEKPATPKRRKRPGARNGHPGARRARPTKIDRREEHRLKRCPHCAGPVQRCRRTRTRIIEDIPEQITPVVTEHILHRDYCPNCKKDVEPVVPDAMPGAALGHSVVALTSWFHYGLGITIAQVIDILSHHLQTRITPGGLVDAWQRLARVLADWYEQIAEQARKSAVLHADETGWRVMGQTCWLWCFANHQVIYYMIDRTRGRPALQKFFTDAFKGTLVTDFWSAYESVCADDRQYCLVHLLRELEKVDDQRTVAPRAGDAEWQAFARKLRRLIRDGIRLRKRPDFSPLRYATRIRLMDRRLTELAQWPREDNTPVHTDPDTPVSTDPDTLRIAKRLRKHGDFLFTFLDKPEVPFDNNLAERAIRPAVILRKNSQSNRSEGGAATQAILMSIYRTLRLRGLDPTKTITAALKTYLQTGQLPPLPEPVAADG